MQHPSQRLNELQMLDHALDTQRCLTRHRGNWAATEIKLLEQSAVTGEIRASIGKDEPISSNLLD